MIDPKALQIRLAKAVTDLGRAGEQYKKAIGDARAAGIECAEAEAEYKRVRYEAELAHEGSAAMARAAGEVASAGALNDWRTLEVQYQAAKDYVFWCQHEVQSCRAVLSAVQTVSSLVKAEAQAGATGP